MRVLTAILALLCAASVQAQTIRADTAGTLKIGPFVDATDGVTPETGLTIEDGDILIAQPSGGALGEEAGVSDCTHDAGGVYDCAYNASVFDTEGMVLVSVQETGAAPWFGRYDVQTGDFYDASHTAGAMATAATIGILYDGAIDATNGSTTIELVDVGDLPESDNSWLNTTVYVTNAGGTESDVALIAAYDYTAGTPDVFEITLHKAASFTLQAGDTVRIHAVGNTNVEMVEGSDATDTLGSAQTGDAFARLGAPAGASVSADIDALPTAAENRTEIDSNSTQLAAILADTDDIGVAGVGLTEAGGTGDQLTGVPWNAAWDAEAQSEAADAITAAGLSAAATAAAVWAHECDPDNSPAIRCDDAIAYSLAYGAGAADAPTDGSVWDINTPDDGTNRIDVTYGDDAGDRAISLTAISR